MKSFSPKALLIALGLVLAMLFVFSATSGLPGRFDPQYLDYGKGPSVGETHMCNSWHGSYPCTASVYWKSKITTFPISILGAFIFIRYAFLIFVVITAALYFLVRKFMKLIKGRVRAQNNDPL